MQLNFILLESDCNGASYTVPEEKLKRNVEELFTLIRELWECN